MPRGEPTEVMHVRLTAAQILRLRDLARMSRRTHSEVLRILIEQATITDLMVPRDIEEKEMAR